MTLENIITNIKQNPLEYITMILAMIGSVYAANYLPSDRAIGFSMWILSNGYMMIGFYRAKNMPYFLLFVFYEIQNIRGVVNNI
jgi:hypothetical protein